MNFANPAALTFLGLAVPIVFLYMLKVRYPRETVSTLMFWEQVFQERRHNKLFQRLRHWWSLLFQLLFLLLVVLALAQPEFDFLERDSRQVILVIDRSASMNAQEGSNSRLDLAKRKARQLVSRLRFTDEMTVVSCDSRPAVIVPFTEDPGALAKAIDAIAPTHIRTNLAPAVALAYAMAATRPHPEVHVLSDFHHVPPELSASLRTPPNSLRLHLHQIGSGASDNVGITRLQARRELGNPSQCEILVTLKNASQEQRDLNLELSLDGVLFDARPYTLAPDELRTEVFRRRISKAGRLTATLDIDDALASDNTAYALLPSYQGWRTLLVTSGNAFLASVLATNPSLDLEVVSPEAYDSTGTDGALVVFDRCLPDSPERGDFLLIAPPTSGDFWRLSGKLTAPRITRWERGHPLLRYVSLENVRVGEASRLQLEAPAQALVHAGEAPLLAVHETPTSRVVLTAFNLLRSDLPLRVAFPVIVTNAVHWFQGNEDREHRTQTGETLMARMHSLATVSSDAATVAISGPDSHTWDVTPNGIEILFTETQLAGFYTLRHEEHQQTWAINLDDESETDLGLDPVVEPLLDRNDRQMRASVFHYPPWVYLALLATLLTVVEWLLHQRRRLE